MNYPTFKYKEFEYHYGDLALPRKIWREVQLIDQDVAASLLPDWVEEFVVDKWYPKYDNDPTMGFICNRDPLDFVDDVSDPHHGFVQEGHYYRCRHPDGRLVQYYHDGKLTWDEANCCWQSTQQGGFAGRPIMIMINPRKILQADPKYHDFNNRFIGARNRISLNGPWHTGHPKNYCNTSYKIEGDKYDLWYHGLGVTNQLMCVGASAFFPTQELRLFEVLHFTIQDGSYKNRWRTLEPFVEGQEVPKSVSSDVRVRRAVDHPLLEISRHPNTWTEMQHGEPNNN